MTIRRILVSLGLQAELFFYPQFKDNESHHWIETASPGLNTVSLRGAAMSRNLCLTRQCLGLVTRIECAIRPLAGDTGMWTLLFAAGMAGEQPSALKAQGPFPGPNAAESILDTIVQALTLHGYELANDPQIWCLHMQAQLREINGGRCRNAGGFEFHPPH